MDIPSCYIIGFLGKVKLFLSPGDMGELEERREQGKINPNTAYCALTEVDWCVGVISKGQDTQNLNIGLSSYKKALKSLPT